MGIAAAGEKSPSCLADIAMKITVISGRKAGEPASKEPAFLGESERDA